MALNTPNPDRHTLRQHLLSARRAWSQTPAAQAAQARLHERVLSVLAQLEPDCLGLYWPMQGEFNPRDAALAAQRDWGCQLALPWAEKNPVAMHFRLWNGQVPDGVDHCGLPSPAQGKPLVPDVVLVPCVGFCPQGWRLGYGGGYFDRFLASHPEVTAIGLAWEAGLLSEQALQPQTHDLPLLAVLTESNTYSA